ncbi:MAG: hypothetical protein ABIQ31_13940 [Ferruginibacter sp.]
MEDSGNIDLAMAFRKLMSENKSQEARLDEYARIISSRDNEIGMLQTMLSEANEQRSSVDNQLNELKDLRRYLNDLQQQVAGSVYRTTGRQQHVPNDTNAEDRLQNLNKEYTYLQSQLADLQTQLTEVNNRNLLLQQQNSRIAELESLLENAQEEIGRYSTVHLQKKN